MSGNSPSIDRTVRFGPFEADLGTRQLRKHGLRVRLQDQPFQILAAFLERPGEVVTREFLRSRLWPEGVYVDFDNSLNAAINKLREALSDSADSPRYIETLPRRGYRFIAAIEPGAQVRVSNRPGPGTSPVLATSSTEDSARIPRRAATVVGVTLIVFLLAAGYSSWTRLRQSAAAYGTSKPAGGYSPAPSTSNPEAYDAYLQGLYHWNRRTDQGVRKGLEYFQEAIRKDPNFALAWAGVANCYLVNGGRGWSLPAEETYARARNAARKALQLDPSLAEAHATLAVIRFEHEWDFAGAEQEFRQAIELNPAYPTAHQWLAEYLAATGRLDEALAEIRRAQALDPFSRSVNQVYALILMYAGQYDEATRRFQKLIERDPDYLPAHAGLARIYRQRGMEAEWFASYRNWLRLLSTPEAEMAEYRQLFAREGMRGILRRRLEHLKSGAVDNLTVPYAIARIHAVLGEKDAALEWLEKAAQVRDDFVAHVNVDPELAALRSDPRFAQLLRRIGLPH